MRRALWTVPFSGLVLLSIGFYLFKPVPSAAEPEKRQDGPPSAKAAELPIGQVVLFSSGVGYFQREGTVEGNTRIDLSFPVADINDLLKSLLLRDLDGGHINAVSPSPMPCRCFSAGLA